MKISLIMPVYNEQEILGEVIAKYKTDLVQTVKNLGGTGYEFIAINDGCSDNSVEVMGAEAKLNSNFKIVNFDQRYGKEAAIAAGFEMATGDVVLVADVDLLNPLGVLERLVEEYVDGSNIVYGYRERIGKEARKDWISDLFVRMGTKIFQIEGQYMGKANVMLFSRPVADILREFPERNKMMRMMNSWSGFEIAIMGYASNYTKQEVKRKIAEAKALDKRQGNPQVIRSKAREHTPSKIYAITGLLMAVAFIMGWVALDMFMDNLSLWWHLVLCFILIIIILCSLMFMARSVMIKRIGTLHNKEDSVMYVVKGVVNG
ncbi:MAG: glycosyltransferase [Firmicutes bacterium]|nr:glycosyltransferase [Bacillota bacterium]